jgi:hypothetical protein
VKQVTPAEFSSGITSRERICGILIGHRARWDEREAEMGRPIQALSARRSWSAGNGERLWLSMLIDAMEQVSRPEPRAKPCDGATLASLRAQLALPASIRFASPFSLRN